MIWGCRIRFGYFINNLFDSLFHDLWVSDDPFDDPLDRLCDGHCAGRSAVDIGLAVRLGALYYSPNVECFKVGCSLVQAPLCQRTVLVGTHGGSSSRFFSHKYEHAAPPATVIMASAAPKVLPPTLENSLIPPP